MADLAAIKAAIATRYSGVTDLSESTSTVPDIGDLPTLKVRFVDRFAIDDSLGGRGAGFEARMLRVNGVLLVDKQAEEREALLVAESIVEGMFSAARSSIKLGLSYVMDSHLSEARIGNDIEYEGTGPWVGAEVLWLVTIRENVTRTA